MNKIKVLIIDDSAIVRQTLENILSSDKDIEVIGTASDPFIAAKKMQQIEPDVITLDVEMPRMDGITFLQKLMAQHPMPVVLCSSLAGDGSETAMKALEAGAVEIIHKPQMATRQFLEESRILICDAVKAAAQTRPKKQQTTVKKLQPAQKLTADVILPRTSSKAMVQTTEKVVVVGASTGGTEALRVFLESLPSDAPGTLIVQHMPEKFTKAFCRSPERTLPGHGQGGGKQ